MLIPNSVSKQTMKSLTLTSSGVLAPGPRARPAEKLGRQHWESMAGKELKKPQVTWKEKGHSLRSKRFCTVTPFQLTVARCATSLPACALSCPWQLLWHAASHRHSHTATAGQHHSCPGPSSCLPWFPAARENSDRAGSKSKHCISTDFPRGNVSPLYLKVS